MIIVVAVAFAFLVRGFAFQTFYIPSESMVPRLQTDDRVLVNKLTYDLRDPARGDVVVFRTPPGSHITGMDDLVKRIVGMPGETIEGRDGHIYINGKLLAEPYLDADVQSKTFGRCTCRRTPTSCSATTGSSRTTRRCGVRRTATCSSARCSSPSGRSTASTSPGGSGSSRSRPASAVIGCLVRAASVRRRDPEAPSAPTRRRRRPSGRPGRSTRRRSRAAASPGCGASPGCPTRTRAARSGAPA